MSSDATNMDSSDDKSTLPLSDSNPSTTKGKEMDDDDASMIKWTDSSFYYQNPTTGTVSSSALSMPQLVKLLVPVREGMLPILPAHTQCLEIPPQQQQQQTTPQDHSEDEEQPQQPPSFGSWTSVSTVDILKEAACHQWYLTGTGEKGETQGPFSCRTLMEVYTKAQDRSKLLVYAQNITKEWTLIEKLPNLQRVLQALEPQAPLSIHSEEKANDNDVKTTLGGATTTSNNDGHDVNQETIQNELEAFLSSHIEPSNAIDNNDNDDDDDDDGHAYESDGGTRYVKEPLTGRWIHEALAPSTLMKASSGIDQNEAQQKQHSQPKKESTNNHLSGTTDAPTKSKKSKKAKFSKRNARNWVYVTGLPTGSSSPPITTEDIQRVFSKAGLLDLDPETMQPKIKLYKNPDGSLKGDASVCFARPESVELALQVLDESLWDQHHTIRVERAKFESKASSSGNDIPGNGAENLETGGKRKRTISQAQRKVARLALLQAQDEGFGERLAGGRKGLRIVVVKNMLNGIPEAKWEEIIQEYCNELDVAVEKITCISKTQVVIIKFVEPTAASQAIETWNGKVNSHGTTSVKMEALYWDGVTDYTHSAEESNPEEEEKRHEEFGKWLEEQGEDELPPELRLQVADS